MRTTKLLSVLFVGGLALAACGKSSSSSAKDTTTTKAEAPTSTAAAAPATAVAGQIGGRRDARLDQRGQRSGARPPAGRALQQPRG